jgi:hypothetical protein
MQDQCRGRIVRLRKLTTVQFLIKAIYVVQRMVELSSHSKRATHNSKRDHWISKGASAATKKPRSVIVYRDNGNSGPRSGPDSKLDKLLNLANLLFDQPVG